MVHAYIQPLRLAEQRWMRKKKKNYSKQKNPKKSLECDENLNFVRIQTTNNIKVLLVARPPLVIP